MRVLVVGSGIAGLIAAYRASARHDVVLVTKASAGEANTAYAQGGIAAALFPDDSAESHAADTLRAADGLADPEAVRILTSEGPTRVRELIALGVAFDRDGASGDLARGHEAAHSARRVVHAGGDATGREIERALLAAVRASAVALHEDTALAELILRDGRVVGAELLGPSGLVVEPADAVIIATGGAGRLFAHTTNPAVTTGDGVAAAWRAGAELTDVEFYQFHPTALAVAGTPLISEAVRGDGGVLLDEDGRRFMFDVHPDGELAPRDVVARGIAAAMARQGGRPVLLDATALGAEYLERRFPGLTATTRAHGFDWAREPIPVTPAAHYWMGGCAHRRRRAHQHPGSVLRRRGSLHGRARRQPPRLELAARIARLRRARRRGPRSSLAHPSPAGRAAPRDGAPSPVGNSGSGPARGLGPVGNSGSGLLSRPRRAENSGSPGRPHSADHVGSRRPRTHRGGARTRRRSPRRAAYGSDVVRLDRSARGPESRSTRRAHRGCRAASHRVARRAFPPRSP